MLPDRFVSVPRIREAAQARADATSGRAAAREIGVSHRGLELFLAGARPQPRTLAKLRAWYTDHVERADGPPIAAADAIRVLVRTLPPEHREAAASTLVSTIAALHTAVMADVPPDLVTARPENPAAV